MLANAARLLMICAGGAAALATGAAIAALLIWIGCRDVFRGNSRPRPSDKEAFHRLR